MDYREAVEAAAKAVEGLKLTPEQSTVAFQEVLRAALTAGSSDTEPKKSASVLGTKPAVGLDGPAQRMAARLNLDTELLSRLFAFDLEDAQLEIELARLPEAKAPASQLLALITCAVRQLGYGEEETSVDEMRRVCEEFGKYDESNYAGKLKTLAPEFVRLGGTARKFTFKLTRPGVERVRAILLELSGGTPETRQ